MNETETNFGIMGCLEQPSPSDARDRDIHFEQINVMIEIKLFFFFSTASTKGRTSKLL